MPSSLLAIGWSGLISRARFKLASARSRSPDRLYAMPRSMCGAIASGALSVTLVRTAIPSGYCCCASNRRALSYSARTSPGTRTSWVTTKPVASCWISTFGGRFAAVAGVAQTASTTTAASIDHPRSRAAALQLVACGCKGHLIRCRLLLGLGRLHRLGRRRLVRSRGRLGCRRRWRRRRVRRRAVDRGGRLRCRRGVGVALDRSEEAARELALRIARRHQVREPAQALVDPGVEDSGSHQLHVLLVDLDGLFLERVRLFLERELVFLAL